MKENNAPERLDQVTLASPQYALPEHDALDSARRAGEHGLPAWDHDYPALAARIAELEARIARLEAAAKGE